MHVALATLQTHHNWFCVGLLFVYFPVLLLMGKDKKKTGEMAANKKEKPMRRFVFTCIFINATR